MRNVSSLVGGAAAALALAAARSCGGSSSTGPSGTCTPSTNPNTLVVMNNAVCPSAITVARGGQLTIINQDSTSHDMTSDPHPEHTDCPELNAIGFLNPGQTRSSNNLNTARRCGMHDHINPNSTALRATITIQ
jgi:hypothetical protein